MPDMPPKKKRPRVAGQPRPGAERSTRPAGVKPVAGTARRAPIQRLGSSSSTGAVPAKSAPAKSVPAKQARSARRGAPVPKPAGSSSTGGSTGGAGAVAKTAPGRSGSAGSTAPRGPLVLAAAGIVALLIGLVGFWHPGGANGQDKAFVDTSATTEVLGQVEDAACTVLGPRRGQTVDKWVASSRAVLVGQARADWEGQLPANRQMIEQSQQTNECRVDSIGVRELTGGQDGATAQVLANLVISLNQGGSAAGSVVVGIQYRVLRQAGKWKITRVDTWR